MRFWEVVSTEGGQSCANPFALYLFNLGISARLWYGMCAFSSVAGQHGEPTYCSLPLFFYWLKILISIRSLYVERWATTLVQGPCLFHTEWLSALYANTSASGEVSRRDGCVTILTRCHQLFNHTWSAALWNQKAAGLPICLHLNPTEEKQENGEGRVAGEGGFSFIGAFSF